MAWEDDYIKARKAVSDEGRITDLLGMWNRGRITTEELFLAIRDGCEQDPEKLESFAKVLRANDNTSLQEIGELLDQLAREIRGEG